VEPGLISSFPVRLGGGKVEIVPNLELNAFSRARIESSISELREERALVSELIPA
jgi:malate dehydrogenase